MQAAAAANSLHAAASDATVRPGERRTIEQTADAAGISVDLLRRVVIAAGLRLADDDYRDADERTFRLFALGAELFGDEPTLRFTRVMGTALAGIADAAISLFLVSLEDPMLRQGTAPVVRAQATRRQRASSAYETAPGAFRLAIGFVDLVGFTPLARDLPPAELGDLVEEFEMTANEVVGDSGGRV